MIINHNSIDYVAKTHENGAYYYSKEICKNIIPFIETERNWITIRINGKCFDNSIVFIHNNLRPDLYEYLKKFKNLILVCGIPETCKQVEHLGTPIYLPLSVDVKYVERFRKEKTKDCAYVGRKLKRQAYAFSFDVDYLEDLPREQLLSKMAEYKEVYAVGRCAIEAKVLGCEVLPYDKRFPDVNLWQVRDNSEVIPMLQSMIDAIDGKENRNEN